MAKYISLNVINTFNAASQATQGQILVPSDKITAVTQAANGSTLTVRTSESATSLWLFTLSTNQGAAAAVPPVFTGQQSQTVVGRVQYALTANPGGVNAKVSLGSDFTGGVPTSQTTVAGNLPIYVFSAAYTA